VVLWEDTQLDTINYRGKRATQGDTEDEKEYTESKQRTRCYETREEQQYDPGRDRYEE
jgi:hypothetical protein